MEYTEPKIHKEKTQLGNLPIEFEGEQFKGSEILDTRVKLNGETLCWITWVNKDIFLRELSRTISKYEI